MIDQIHGFSWISPSDDAYCKQTMTEISKERNNDIGQSAGGAKDEETRAKIVWAFQLGRKVRT